MAEIEIPTTIANMPNAEYHAHPAVSTTGIKAFMRSPAHYQALLAGESKDTPAMRFGRMAHMAILEPERWATAHIVAPVCDRRTKAGKEAYAAFEAESVGKERVTADELETLKRMQDACYAHPRARVLLDRPGGVEVSAFAYHEKSGEAVKCRPDKACGDGIVADLKTCDDASPSAFARSCARYGYDVQAAFYEMAWKGAQQPFESFLFIAVEKTPPYAVNVYSLKLDDRYAARCRIDDELMKMADCRIKKIWPSGPEHVIELELPKWHNILQEDGWQ